MKIQYTSAYDKAVKEKVAVYRKLENKNFENLTINIDNLLIIFQCFPKDDPARKVKEYKIMRRKTPKLELYLILDYDKILNGTDTENLQHIKSVFKKGCEKFLKPMQGFDWAGFEKEVLKLF